MYAWRNLSSIGISEQMKAVLLCQTRQGNQELRRERKPAALLSIRPEIIQIPYHQVFVEAKLSERDWTQFRMEFGLVYLGMKTRVARNAVY